MSIQGNRELIIVFLLQNVNGGRDLTKLLMSLFSWCLKFPSSIQGNRELFIVFLLQSVKGGRDLAKLLLPWCCKFPIGIQGNRELSLFFYYSVSGGRDVVMLLELLFPWRLKFSYWYPRQRGVIIVFLLGVTLPSY